MPTINWKSEENLVLLNPRFSVLEKRQILEMLSKSPPIKGHFWIATSGSTSLSKAKIKWTALSKEAVLASAAAVNTHLASTNSDIWLNPLPHFHVGGLGIFARAYLSQTAVIDAYSFMKYKWNVDTFYTLLCYHNVTLTSLVPTQVYDLVSQEKKSPPSLRAVIVGGGALLPSLYIKAIELGWKLLPSYGLTECASQVATTLPSDSCPLSLPKMTLLPHLQASINSKGRILLKGSSLFSFYAIQCDKETQFIDPKIEGWFETDDFGEIESNGIKVSGRQNHFIKIGGESVDLLRVNRILEEIKTTYKCPWDITLVPMPDIRLGSVIHLAVAGAAHHLIDLVVGIYQNEVLPFEKIKKIHYIDKIPRTELGKVRLHLLIAKCS